MIEFITFCLVYVNFTIVFEFVTEIGHVDDADIERLPDPVPRGDFRPISLPSGEATYIAFDLETTGLSKHLHSCCFLSMKITFYKLFKKI